MKLIYKSLITVIVLSFFINCITPSFQAQLSSSNTTVMIHNKYSWSGVGDIIRNTGTTPFINTSAVDPPYLTFSHMFDVRGYDVAQVYINYFGWAWTKIAEFTGTINDWAEISINLPNWSHGEAVRFKFVYITDENSTGDGWCVDNICLKQYMENGDDILLYKQDFEEYVIGDRWGHWTILKETSTSNDPPNQPHISGPQKGKATETYEFIFETNDPNNDDVFYYIDWGDNESLEWIGPYLSNQKIKINHTWKETGDYLIQVQAKDVYNETSTWSSFEVSMPKHKHLPHAHLIETIKTYFQQRFKSFFSRF